MPGGESMKLDTSLVTEIKNDIAVDHVNGMEKQGRRDCAILTHRDGYTIIKSIYPSGLRHVSVSHWGDSTSVKTAEAFARSIYPEVERWEAMNAEPSSVMHMWEAVDGN